MKHPASIEESAKEPVLLLHCSASSGRQWDGLVTALPPGYRALAPDLYGYGSAPGWSGPGPLKLSAESALAGAPLPPDADAVHVVGHSYGGAVALRFAVEQPWRVKSLTLIEPVAFHTLREGGGQDRRLLDGVHRIAAAVIKNTLIGDYHGAMRRFVDFWNGRGAWERSEPETRRRLSRHAPKVVLDFHAAVNEDTTLATYRGRFRFPLLVIRGALSPDPTRRVAELLTEDLANASLVTIEDAGHMLPFTHPEVVNAKVISHLDASRVDERRAA